MINKVRRFIYRTIKKCFKLLLNLNGKFTCPFCGNKSNNFDLIGENFPVLSKKQIIGSGIRLGGCNKCGSTDRERLVYIYLKEKTELFKSVKTKSILHIAPECNLSQKLFDFGFSNYICGDLHPESYNLHIPVKKINLLKTQYNDDTFDLIICNHVLEHIPNDLQAMKELKRILKPNGKAILQVPISKISKNTFEDFSVIDPKQREDIFGQFDHIRIYGQDYVTRLEECGFIVNRINISKKYIKYGLNQDEDIFICQK